MNHVEVKRMGFLFFGILMILLVLISLLGIWGFISTYAAWKGVWSLGILGMATYIIVQVGNKLFNTK